MKVGNLKQDHDEKVTFGGKDDNDKDMKLPDRLTMD